GTARPPRRFRGFGWTRAWQAESGPGARAGGPGARSLVSRRASSLTVLQALGEGVRQARRPDRRGGAGDVVGGAQEGRRQAVEVEQKPGGAGISVARLADAAGVQKPFAGRDVEPAALAAGLPGRELAAAAHERERHVGMADQAHALALFVQAQLG